MTVKQLKVILDRFPEDRELVICGKIPNFLYKCIIKEWNVYDNEIRMVTEIDTSK